MVCDVLAQSKLSVCFQARKYFDIAKEVCHNLNAFVETFCVASSPPVSQVTVLIELTALVVKSVSHFMTDNYADSTIVECVVSVHIKERILKDTCREADFVSRRIIISVHCLRSHQPFFLIYWFAKTAVVVVQRPFACTAIVCPIRVFLNIEVRIVFPSIRISHLYVECSQFFLSYQLSAVAHPVLRIDAFAKSSLQVLNQLNHTFFSCSREVLFYIHLSYSFAQHTVYSAYRTFPTWRKFLTTRKYLSVEVETSVYEVVAQA